MAIDIRKSLKKYLPHLLQAQSENLNEADTVQRLIKVFEEVLGYDAMTDISREAQMKNKYVDIALKIDGAVRLLVEAKAAGEKLRDRHIEQAQSYASRNNYRWVLLTNGVEWNLYHLTFEEGIEYQRAFTVDLNNAAAFDQSAELLELMHKHSIKRGALDAYWEKSTALNPATIARALFLEEVLGTVRREIRRETDVLIDPEDLAAAIHNMLSADARELIGPLKIRKRRGVTKRTAAPGEEAPADATPSPQPPAVPVTPAGDATPPPRPPVPPPKA